MSAGKLSTLRPDAAAQAFALEQRQLDLALHREVRCQRGDLEGAGEPGTHALCLAQSGHVFATQPDLAAVGREHTADLVHQRGLAGAVGADERQAVAGCELERHIARHMDAAKTLVEVAQFKQAAHDRSPQRARNQAIAFAGGTSTTSINMPPTTNSQW